MSVKHPIFAVTGSSGAGTTTISHFIRQLFSRLCIKAAFIEGDCFHRFSRAEMAVEIRKANGVGRNISYFGPEANAFEGLEALFKSYSEKGTGNYRRYLHTFDEAAPLNQMPGTFTPWQAIPENTDLLFYEGLHGGVVTDSIDVAQHADLLIGMVPIVNLEWIQKIQRDTHEREHSREDVTANIVRSMDDYIKYITPQFSRTHINFQRIPTVDTSNPFSATNIPTLDESMLVIHFQDDNKIDFPYMLQMIGGSFMSRINTIVVPGAKMGIAIELILTPLIQNLLQKR